MIYESEPDRVEEWRLEYYNSEILSWTESDFFQKALALPWPHNAHLIVAEILVFVIYGCS